MNTRTKVFAAAIVVQLVVLFALPANQYMARYWGHEVQLRVEMLDPPSVLSGYYVRLRYEISRPIGFDDFSAIADGTPIYTVVAPGIDGVANAMSMSLEYPDARGNQHVIKGEKKGNDVVYAIGEYFIPEAARNEVEQGLRDSNNDRRAIVRLDKRGNPSLRGLRIGDTRY